MKTEKEIIDDLKPFLEILPIKISRKIMKEDELIEVVLDLGRPPIIRYTNQQDIILDLIITQNDINYVINKIGHVGDDNRAGIERTLHRISLIRNRAEEPIGVTCRVGRAVFGSVKIIEDFIGSEKSILIMGKPGIGKTTMIREITRIIADKEEKRVVVVDTSNEIAGDGDIPHPAIGSARRMQVRNTDQQHNVMIEAVENHMPEVVVIDEISTEKEADACRTIAERGVQLIATAHGNTLDNLIINPTISDLVGGTKSVTLGDLEARRRKSQKSVLERQHEPTFDIVVEIIDRNKVSVHFDVALAVDKILRGIVANSEIRSLENGEVIKLNFKNKSKKLKGTPFSPKSLIKTQITTHDYNQNDVIKNNSNRITIFPFGIQKSKLKNSAKSLFTNINIVETVEKAQIILTTKSHYMKKPKTIQLAEKIGISIHILKKGSNDQIIRFLSKIKQKTKPEKIDLIVDIKDEDALNEVKIAEKKIQKGDIEVELKPRDPNIRRKQHFLATTLGLGSASIGQDSNRRLVIKKRG